MSRALAVAAMKAHLQQFSPPFQAVYIGEPLGLPPGVDYAAAIWYAGEGEEKTETMTQVMVTDVWRCRVYWRPRLALADREALELAVWDCSRNLQAAFRADAQLGGNCDDLKVSLAQGSGWVDVGRLGVEGAVDTYRALTFDLELWNLNAEEIAP